MSNIYDFPLSYNLAKYYVNFTFKSFYSEFIIVGKENIPADTPVIFAPNHNNALMDALAILAAIPHELPIVFLSRSDIFRNSILAKGLTFAKMIPAFRMRDGVENLGRNNETFDLSVDVLSHNCALGIMPEGNQGELKKLRPLVKGIFRIAFAAQLKMGTTANVKIIPVGIDYGSYEKFGKHLIIQFGKSIELSEYMSEFTENPVSATNAIRIKLSADIKSLSQNLATETYYDCFETVIEVFTTLYCKVHNQPINSLSKFYAKQLISEKLTDLESLDIPQMNQLDVLCKEYKKGILKLNLKTEIIETPAKHLLILYLEGFFLVSTFVVFLSGILLNLLPFFIPVLLRKYVFKAQYSGFFSSLHYGIGIITFPLFYTIQAILLIEYVNFDWWAFFVLIPIQFILGKWAYRWYRKMIKYFARVRFSLNQNSNLVKSVQKLRVEIIDIMLKIIK